VLLTDAAAGPRQLIVLWNDGSGGFSKDAISALGDPDQPPQAFAALPPATAANRATLAYVSEHNVHLLKPRHGQRGFSDQPILVELEHGTGIAATDIDGDGITDLVVADAGSLRVLLAGLVQ